MSLDLPPALSRYFALANGDPGVRADDCFTADAIVHDERQDHQSTAAISTWIAKARAAYQHQVQPLSVDVKDGRHVVTSRVRGNFPGSPVVLTHAFVLADDRIVALEIV
ncbi:nuclear transport factor 2 family protein [Stenotrophomonas sp. 24(2023)]|uniref:nuclear transport factor 2 family protein n=1 Tax=Stenotrophomonas sp. 24(2023) TaxID=3068324 RepID=UPI0027DF2627|nr:nuclear transport factor 2 family protein [Stenotrophomonas sp. 24(2023)]WMJ68638.1 nuclear transport factor 2 family protein [Stenotrophomonas sp. 24(2023)]